MIQFDDAKTNVTLKALREKEEEQLVMRAATQRGMKYIDLAGYPISTEALSVLEEDQSHKTGLAGFKIVANQVHMVVLSEQQPETRTVLDELHNKGFMVTLYLASHRSLERAWDRYNDLRMTHGSQGGFLEVSADALQNIAEQVKTKEDVKKLFQNIADEEEQKRTSKLTEIIMGSAIALKASDVHIEPQEEQARLRYRIDGIMDDITDMNHATYKQLLSRIKILSGMKINITKNAQDGRFTINFKDVEIEIRVSTAPGAYGEGVVMRLLDPRGLVVDLEQLGIEPLLLEILRKEIAKPNGLILNTGPTGSGKTTTLYSFLKYIQTPEIKIITIEDPIEYHLDGVEQTPIDAAHGYDFESGLRSAMRHDPDVILVGEIRDHETALAAMQASQTGHMVFSTLHTNNASGTVPRLLDLGINHATLAQSMTVALAQRLVRKLTDAKKKVRPTPEQETIMRTVLRRAITNGKDLSRFEIRPDMDMWIYEPAPTDVSPSGFKGRLGIFEAILIDDHIKDILDKNPTDRQVREASLPQGILTLAEDAVIKIIKGITSYDEVRRVVDLEEDIRDELLQSKKEENHPVSIGGETSFVSSSPSPTSSDLVDQIKSNLDKEKSSGSSSLPSKEVNMMVDYLRMLENHQKEFPGSSVAGKVQEVQSTIIDLLKTYQPNDLFLQRDNERLVQQEIDLLMHNLEDLKQHQLKNPNIGVADKLRTIRTTLEEIAK